MEPLTIEQLVDPAFVEDRASLSIEEVRRRRSACQDAEEALSLHRRLVQGRLDIVQAELLRRTGGEAASTDLVGDLPDILVEHGDRHLGPGRLTSVNAEKTTLGADFDALTTELDRLVDGARLSNLPAEDGQSLLRIAEGLDSLERSISQQRHKLHRHIDFFQEEIVRRYKTGEASVDSLLES